MSTIISWLLFWPVNLCYVVEKGSESPHVNDGLIVVYAVVNLLWIMLLLSPVVIYVYNNSL